MSVTLKRVYDAPKPADGKRILVDRLWPRGLSKEKAKIDLWIKEIGPSTDLRTWFGHEPAKWQEFARRYTQELRANRATLAVLQEEISKGDVTLLYAAKDSAHNNAVVLHDFLSRSRAA